VEQVAGGREEGQQMEVRLGGVAVVLVLAGGGDEHALGLGACYFPSPMQLNVLCAALCVVGTTITLITRPLHAPTHTSTHPLHPPTHTSTPHPTRMLPRWP
jgi:hypothetical protein